MTVHTNRAAFLFSAYQAQGTSTALDTRTNAPYGLLWYQCSGQSAIFRMQLSHDNASWFTFLTLTATATMTATAQISGTYCPYIRASAGPVYTGTGGATSGTGTLWVHFTPGIIL